MSINLAKGQKIDLSKGGYGLSQVMVGLGWDEVQQNRGLLGSLFGSKPQDIDCDAFAIMLGYDGKLLHHTDSLNECTVFFNNLLARYIKRMVNGNLMLLDNLFRKQVVLIQ